jgi:hypothetical protein
LRLLCGSIHSGPTGRTSTSMYSLKALYIVLDPYSGAYSRTSLVLVQPYGLQKNGTAHNNSTAAQLCVLAVCCWLCCMIERQQHWRHGSCCIARHRRGRGGAILRLPS